jgi:3',5'-cyclic AMP phosphodiesterase CpdA
VTIRIAVVADSHFHPPGVPAQAAWASDAHFNARNAAVVTMLQRAAPSAVIHLGDVPHPVPGLPEHRAALDVARATYAPLEVPLYVVPGNHDVGDKPHPWAPAPSVSVEKHETFANTWGPPWWVVAHEGLRLVGIDTPVLNSGLALEAEQWRWLEDVLDGAARTFVFLHYPPFLLTPDEPEHYDNLAEPARSRLLALFTRARVEAVFCGHVHHPFWNRHGDLDLYLLPSTAFVRPEYSELGRIAPGPAFGRDDTERLGFCLLHVEPVGHRVEWVRTHGATEAPTPPPGEGPGEVKPSCPLGLTLRHSWDAVLDLPADGLEPFRRKRARNDLVLLATWELGVQLLRLPIDDLRNPSTRERLVALERGGQQVVLFTAEPLTDEDRRLLERHRSVIRAVELVLPRAWLGREVPAVAVPVWIAALGRAPGEEGRYFSHFAPHGFRPDDPDLARATAGDGLVFRAEPDEDPVAVAERITSLPRAALLSVLLPRAGEGAEADDDDAVTRSVLRALAAARAHPGLAVVLDTTVDHDRGYFPRHGLLDRRGNPRPAFRRLAEEARRRPAGVTDS